MMKKSLLRFAFLFLLSVMETFLYSSTLIAQPTIKRWDKSFGNAPWGVRGRASGGVPRKTADGNFIIPGGATFHAQEDKTESGLGYDDPWIIKFRPDGTKIWDKTLREFGYSGASDLILTADGGYLVCALSSAAIGGDKTEESRGRYDYWIVKLDANGNIEWDKTFGGSDVDAPVAIFETADGGFLVAGDSRSGISGEKSTENKGGQDIWLVKMSSTGEKLWDTSFGGSIEESLTSMKQTDDGGYLLGCVSTSPSSGDKSQGNIGGRDFWLIKINSEGVKQWDKTIGGAANDVLSYMHPESDGGFVVAGTSESNAGFDKTENARGRTDLWLVKIDALGNILWDKTLGGTDDESISYMENTLDGGYLLAATSASFIGGDKSEPRKIHDDSNTKFDYWLVKLSADHQKLWDRTIGGDSDDFMIYATEYEAGKYFMLGYSESTLYTAPQDRSVQRKGLGDIWMTEFWEESALPVSLATFAARQEGSTTNLSWETTSETRSDHFDVEHSVNAKAWNTIATVNAAGESNALKSYHFNHSNPQRGDNYYRLKIIDTDGTFAYSSIEQVKFEFDFDVSAYPNPVTETIHINSSDWSQVKGLQILNSQGEALYNARNKPSQDINARSLRPGLYFIKITLADGTERIRKIAVGQ